MKQVSESVLPDGISENTPASPEGVDHLDDTVFCRRLCKVQLSVRMTEFPQRGRCLSITL